MSATPAAPAMQYFAGRASLIPCAHHADPRGSLLPFEFDQMPLVPRRAFVITDVPAGTIRGGHAHRSGTQWLVCLQGRIEIVMRYLGEQVTLLLEPSKFGLLFGPGVWCQQTYLDAGSVLLAFSSEAYDPDTYLEQAG